LVSICVLMVLLWLQFSTDRCRGSALPKSS
jgi:hypothetical protein